MAIVRKRINTNRFFYCKATKVIVLPFILAFSLIRDFFGDLTILNNFINIIFDKRGKVKSIVTLNKTKKNHKSGFLKEPKGKRN